MSNLCFDINTPVSISNGIDLTDLGAVLQTFTSQYLYVTNGKLRSVDKVTDLKPSHSLIKFEGYFHLCNNTNQNMLYCYKKELADYLNTHKINQLVPRWNQVPGGYPDVSELFDVSDTKIRSEPTLSDDIISYIIEKVRSGVECLDENIDNELGDLKRGNVRDEYNDNLNQLINRRNNLTENVCVTKSEIELATRFGMSVIPDKMDIEEVELVNYPTY